MRIFRLVFLLLVGTALFGALAWAGGLGIGPIVVVREDEQKVVVRLIPIGNSTRVLSEPGISLRIPLLEQVQTLDRRLLYLNAEPRELQTVEQERIVVDNYVVWRIADPLQFVKSFPTGMAAAQSRIGDVVRDDVREVIGQRTLGEVVTTKRAEIMKSAADASRERMKEFGVEIIEVRINRTELPEGATANVYQRMRTEREARARQLRAEGEENGRQIRAEADKDAQIVVANAKRDSEIVRGEGDAKAAAIYAEAYTQAPEFYGFVRNLEAYRKTIGDNTTLVLPPDSEFFRILASDPASNGPR